MIERVWLITDADTGDVSYIQHGRENDEKNWKLIGPFAFTTKTDAQQAAQDPRFLPEGAHGQFSVLEVESSGFVQAIFNGFPPALSDVFMLDDGLFPLTQGGARWVDDALNLPLWQPLFDENGSSGGLAWLDRVLEQVAGRMRMSMETVLAIGSMNAAAEDAAEIDQTQAMVNHNVRLRVAPEEGTFALDEEEGLATLPPTATFVVATSGLASFGLPELEFRDVPAAWVQGAGLELLRWAVHALDHGIRVEDYIPKEGPLGLVYEAVGSTNPRWIEEKVDCLHLVLRSVTIPMDQRYAGQPVH